MDQITQAVGKIASFFDRPGVQMDVIKAGKGVPFGIERVFHPLLKIGGVYGTWGESFDNEHLPSLLEERLGHPLAPEQRLSLADLGFTNRHHIKMSTLTPDQHIEVEVEIGARLLKEAMRTCGWDPSEVEGVLIGMSAPTSDDYVEKICRAAGIPDSALKVAVHKACDSSVACLHLALNPEMPENKSLKLNIAKTLYGKKVLVGGIEGLSRFISTSHDANALQMFGNGAGVIGVIPGVTMKFIVGKTFENFDTDGYLQVQMYYPHAGAKADSMLDVVQMNEHAIRVAGMMHEPADGSSVIMAGPMGMVKLFVRTGVQVVHDVYEAYQAKLTELGMQSKSISVAIVHHANYKINKLKEKHLQNQGIVMAMPWLLSEFGNISAASNMIAFLRQLPEMKLGDHVLIDGFGAGTYYDALAVQMGG